MKIKFRCYGSSSWAACLFLLLLVAVAIAKNTHPLIYPLIDLFRDTKEAYELIDWGIDAALSVRERIEPRSYPKPHPGSISVEARVERIERGTEKLAPIEYQRSIPDFNGQVRGNRDVRRVLLGQHTNAILTADTELEARKGEIEEMADLEQQLERIIIAMRVVAQALIDAGEKWPEYYGKLGFVSEWFNMEQVYIKRMITVVNRVHHNLEESRQRSQSRSRALISITGKLLPALQAERADIEAEQRALRDRMESLKRDTEALNQQKGMLTNLEAKILARKADIQQLNDELDDCRVEERQLEHRRKNMQSRINSKVNEYNQSYNLCPNDQSYNECTHHELKRQWDKRQRSLKGEIQKLRKEQYELNADINRQKEKTKQLQQEVERNKRQLADEAAVVARKKQEIALESSRLNPLRDALWKDLWSSRTTEIYKASEQDTNRLVNALKRLEARGGLP